MSQKNPMESLDLSGLPEALRKKVQDQLNRMSPEMQQEFLKKSRPMLNRAMDAANNIERKGIEAVHQSHRIKPSGHYNATIQPGDGGSNQILKFVAFLVIAAIVYDFFR
ncbi:MAG TPA: hypothetical protein PLF92_12735 [Arenimonas sp.]|nr:hypothetical protein [Arenimonas sp.]HPO25110.1 hypothetical protein [Arenimonas sp.]HPW33766.1 hypothetical protein [Arenimonas sp.]